LKLYVAIIASIVTIVSGAWAYSPSIIIKPNAFLISSNPLDVQFSVENVGRLTAYDLVFECTINSPSIKNFRVGATMTTSPSGELAGQKVTDLAAGESATRDCGDFEGISLGGGDFYPATIDFKVTYRWPLIRLPGSVTRHFSSRRDSSGHISIVPDKN
jgi:hypothetical protein